MSPRLVALAAVALLAGCGADVNEGRVVDRYYSESYVWFQVQCVNGCKSTILIPVTEPEHWVVTLENCDLREDADDECPTERHDVDPATYDRTEVGAWLDLSDGDK